MTKTATQQDSKTLQSKKPVAAKSPAKKSATTKSDDRPAPTDINKVTLLGRLAVEPDLRTFSSGASLARLLVTTRFQTDRPRTDVVPVTVWDPSKDVSKAPKGSIVSIKGSVQRRFWTDAEGRQTRVEIVAAEVEIVRKGSPE